MTVALSTRRNGPYTASAGQTAFDFTWQANVAGDLIVTRRRAGVDTVLNFPGDFTFVSGSLANPAGGQISLVVGATAGDQILIEAHTDPERSTAFADERQIRADALNAEFDKVQRQLQELRREVDRSVHMEAFTNGAPPSLPAPVEGKQLAWASGKIVNTDGVPGPAGPPAPVSLLANEAALPGSPDANTFYLVRA